MASTGTDGQPIHDVFVHNLSTAGDDSGQELAECLLRNELLAKPQNSAWNKRQTGHVGRWRTLMETEVGFEPTVGLTLLRFSRPSQSATLAPPRIERTSGRAIRSMPHFVDDIFGDVDRHVNSHGNSDGITRSGVDFDDFTVVPDPELGEVRVSRSSLINISCSSPLSNSIVLASKSWVRGRGTGSPFTRRSMLVASEDADDDREGPLPLDLLEENNLLFVIFVDDDPRKFHLHGHGGTLPLALNSRVRRIRLRRLRLRAARRFAAGLLSMIIKGAADPVNAAIPDQGFASSSFASKATTSSR